MSSSCLNPSPSRFIAYLEGLQRFGIRPGLLRIEALLAACSEPQNSYPVVLVGGTNGKGSTCEFLALALAGGGEGDGRVTGLFTSPHLYRWHERIRVLEPRRAATVANPKKSPAFVGSITDAELDGLFDELTPTIERIGAELGQPTEFEILTLAAFQHFRNAAAEVAVIEVGLGGRFDATNAADPVVSVVTHVALDHCDRLGSTVEVIAADKVGIARPGRPLVTAETKESVLDVLRQHCEAIGARLWALNAPQYTCAVDRAEFDKCLVALDAAQLAGDADAGADSPPPAFQIENARSAAMAQWALGLELGRPTGPLPKPAGVPGRVEVARHDPTVVLDGSNNPDGAAQLAAHLDALYKGRRILFVVGISADKDYVAMLQCWKPLATAFVMTQADNPRAAAAETLAEVVRSSGLTVKTTATVREAVKQALGMAQGSDVICICGSFYVLGEVNRLELANSL